MRKAFTTLAAVCITTLGATAALGAGIDPSDTKLPWMNSTDGTAQYFFADHNKVHVLEAYGLNCSWCNKNAPQVAAMAAEFADDDGVQFLDLGTDQRDQDYARWIQAHRPAYPVVKDVARTVFNKLRTEDGIPQTFVLNCKGELVDSTIGYWGAGEKATLRAAIARAKETVCD